MSLGERIARRRRELGMNQTELARKASVSRQAVSQWENGSIRDIKSQHIATLAKVLRCDPRWLMGQKTSLAVSETPAAYETDLARRLRFLDAEELQRVRELLDKMEEEQRELYLRLKERFEDA